MESVSCRWKLFSRPPSVWHCSCCSGIGTAHVRGYRCHGVVDASMCALTAGWLCRARFRLGGSQLRTRSRTGDCAGAGDGEFRKTHEIPVGRSSEARQRTASKPSKKASQSPAGSTRAAKAQPASQGAPRWTQAQWHGVQKATEKGPLAASTRAAKARPGRSQPRRPPLDPSAVARRAKSDGKGTEQGRSEGA